MDTKQEHIPNAHSPMSVNQTLNFRPTMSSNTTGKKKTKQKNDIVQGFSKVATQLFSNFVEKFDKLKANYLRYLIQELLRLRFGYYDNFFNYCDNLNISKTMRFNSSNVKVFKIIMSDEEKIKFVETFLSCS